jgi:quinol monooxygenase YgiN
MIVRVVKLQFDERTHEEAQRHLLGIVPTVRQWPGCTHLEVLFDENRIGRILTYSHWESVEALNEYRNSMVFRKFWAGVKPHLAKPTEAYTMRRTVHLP